MAGRERQFSEDGNNIHVPGMSKPESPPIDAHSEGKRTQFPALFAGLISVIGDMHHIGMRTHLFTLIDNFPDTKFPVRRLEAAKILADVYADSLPSMNAFIEVMFTQRITPFVEVWLGKQKNYYVEELGLVAVAAAVFFKDEQTNPDRIIPTTAGLKSRLMRTLSEEEYVALFQKDDYRSSRLLGKVSNFKPHTDENSDIGTLDSSVDEQNTLKGQDNIEDIRNRIILKNMSLEKLTALSADLAYVRSIEEIPTPVSTLAYRFVDGDEGKDMINRLRKGILVMVRTMEHLGLSDVQELINYLHDIRKSSNKET